jgi:hypothetical protein
VENSFAHLQQIWFEELVGLSSQHISWVEEQRPPQFKEHVLNHSSKSINFKSNGFIDNTNNLRLKSARFYNETFLAFSFLIMPIQLVDKVPVFAVECVAVSNKIIISIVDVERVGVSNFDENTKSILKECFLKYRSFSNALESTSAWFKDLASPYAVVYSGDINKLSQFKTISIDFLKSYFTTTNLNFAKNEVLNDHGSISRFKRIHLENSSAKKIVSNDDDIEWMNTFLKEYHFNI